MFQSLAQEIGVPLLRLLVARSASIGAEEDYRALIAPLGNHFAEGFQVWAQAQALAGWGLVELEAYDAKLREATVQVRNPWELQMQAAEFEGSWGCPMLQGRLIGIFSYAFGTPCWAEEQLEAGPNEACVTFRIAPTRLTLSAELERLRTARRDQEQRLLRQEIAAKVLELAQAQAEQSRLQDEALRAQAEQSRIQDEALETQARIIAELSTPLIPISDQVVLMPLIGQVDSQRAQRVLTTLLEGVSQRQANCAILDISGLPLVDTHVAGILVQAARSIALLGVEMIITGIRPEVAQTLVGLGLSLDGIRTCGTVQAGIALAHEHSRRRGRRR
ncbi:MAG: STAS domain-containing protein [Candidatus Viridilinea halotolerans]|uniref:STAS domain-containing protein n=1 Tax=Candidatus Viridilinea halotolerans TaxID=2491704 RepID=A0A426U457_9CHLR|nr:MAG: STAS domain-containing protein [Candidatus Viridilinea halotolerans]